MNSIQSTKTKRTRKKVSSDSAFKNQVTLIGLTLPSIEKDDRVAYLIYPEDSFKELFWDVLLSLILLLTCILTPFTLAFSDQVSEIEWYVALEWTIDALFLIDIFINFNTAYYRDDFEMETDRRVIAYNYVTGWFFVDFISILPFDLMAPSDGGGEGGDNLNQVVRLSKVSKIYRLVKIMRLVRLLRIMRRRKQLFKGMKQIVADGAIQERLSYFTMLLIIICHFLSCGWIYVAKLTWEENPEYPNWI